jgi:hypothetical protein
MAVPVVKHNRGEKLNAENLRATLGNQPVPHRFLLIRRVDHRHCGLCHHPSLAIKEIGITVSWFRLSGTDRRNTAGATDGTSAHGIHHEVKTGKAIFHEFRPGTFSHSLGHKGPPGFVTAAAGPPQ